MDAVLARQLAALYPQFDQVDATERHRVLATQTQSITVPTGTVLFDEGTPCRGFPMVISGMVRVARGSPGGRSLELYRVGPGELCVISTACLFGHSAMAASAQTTELTELVLLSRAGFEQLAAFEPFRRLLFGIFGERLADLMALAEALAFQRLDQRLAHALLGHGAVVLLTHQALADELGTVREIVTRLLKRFESQGWVHLARERVDLLNQAALRELASGRLPTA